MQKYLFVKYGPPASGKSSIDKIIMGEYGITKDMLYINDIDSVVENSDLYKERIKEARCKEFYNENSLEKVEQDRDQLEKCTNAYFDTRRELNASELLDEMSKRARDAEKSIVYETTGCGNIDWLIDEIKNIYRPAGYKTIIYYPIVPTAELIARSYNRAKFSGRFASSEYISNCVPTAIENILKFKEVADKVFIYGQPAQRKPSIFDRLYGFFGYGTKKQTDLVCDIMEIKDINSITVGELENKVYNVFYNYCTKKIGGVESQQSYDLYANKTIIIMSILIICVFIFMLADDTESLITKHGEYQKQKYNDFMDQNI